MNNHFTQEELNNLLVLINRANITGGELEAVTALKQKIISLITPVKTTSNTPITETGTGAQEDIKSVEEMEQIEN